MLRRIFFWKFSVMKWLWSEKIINGPVITTHAAECYILCRVTTLSAHLYKWSTLKSHSYLVIILWVMPVCTSWPLPPLHLCRSPDSGQSWVCDDSCHHPSWSKDRHSSQFYLNLSQRLLEVQKFDSERYPQSSHLHWDLVRTPKSRPSFPSSSYYPHAKNQLWVRFPDSWPGWLAMSEVPPARST